MGEYIKRDTAIRAVMAAKWVDGSDGAMAMEIVASPPAADVVPVVRCKDCENAQNECGGMIICRVYKHIMFLHNFYSYGKRKGGGADND
jgi:hypothetical protein